MVQVFLWLPVVANRIRLSYDVDLPSALQGEQPLCFDIRMI